jgi:hypothetical protein
LQQKNLPKEQFEFELVETAAAAAAAKINWLSMSMLAELNMIELERLTALPPLCECLLASLVLLVLDEEEEEDEIWLSCWADAVEVPGLPVLALSEPAEDEVDDSTEDESSTKQSPRLLPLALIALMAFRLDWFASIMDDEDDTTFMRSFEDRWSEEAEEEEEGCCCCRKSKMSSADLKIFFNLLKLFVPNETINGRKKIIYFFSVEPNFGLALGVDRLDELFLASEKKRE